MKKLVVSFASCAVFASAFGAGNFFQDPLTGTTPWGPVTSHKFQDDLVITDLSYDVASIRTYDSAGQADYYTLEIWSGYSNQGGALLHSYQTTAVSPDAALIARGGTGFDVDFDTTGLVLDPGTYILSFSDYSAAGLDAYWFDADLNGVNGKEAYIPDGGFSSSWAGKPLDFSWTVNAAPVPEPTSLAAIGLGALCLLRRRLRRD